MKQIFYKIWHHSPAQWLAILKNKLAVPGVAPEVPIDPAERRRLQKLPRRVAGTTVFLGQRLDFIDASSYLSMLGEIFVRKNYDFLSSRPDPLIIDCGSNIGLSIIYCKNIYPAARIIGFEPDPAAFAALVRNLKNFGWTDVQVFNQAVWSADATLDFQADGSWGGKIEAVPGAQTRKVAAVRLKDRLREDIDFLKIDIEGSETEVLQDCAAELKRVRNLFVEYHSPASQPQTLDKILSIISQAGLRYHLKEAGRRPQPFTDRITTGFDSQVEIYAYRLN